MKILAVNPNKIWSWYPCRDFDDKISWANIPPVPVFEIPEEHRKSEHEYILIDGSHRRLRAISIGADLAVACYDFGERINLERDGLTNFRHHEDSKLYEKLLKAYLIREDLPKLIK